MPSFLLLRVTLASRNSLTALRRPARFTWYLTAQIALPASHMWYTINSKTLKSRSANTIRPRPRVRRFECVSFHDLRRAIPLTMSSRARATHLTISSDVAPSPLAVLATSLVYATRRMIIAVVEEGPIGTDAIAVGTTA